MPDPTWLPEVLREAGLQVEEYPGWKDRGHGDFGDIWGVVCHHTGNPPPGNNPGYIANHPTLGLCSQLHLSRSGVFTVCGAGIAWHAGMGSYPGLPTNNANQVTIGIEAENNGTEGWSDAQYNAYTAGVAAILRKLGEPASHAIGHKEWAGGSQGKWDPGGIDMDDFRADVDTQLKGDPIMSLTDAEQVELLQKVRKVHHELTYGFQSRVAGSPFRDTVAGYVLNSDAADFRNEQRLKALELKVDQLLAVLVPKAGA
ncbi:N-acetylmuramoyl-L-alanine amidase [Nocardia sp. NPDC058480]|uniref:peptidoglycan recognition protein family protein n=1 Tax=Nocardia sp. NPDC058480 TaxID=3346522 RepID=UPI00364A2001